MILPRSEPPDLAMAAPFWEAVADGRLALPRCSICGEWQWYPEAWGTDCAGGELVWQDVATTGTVYSHSTVHRSFLPGGRDDVPYVVGMIDLDGIDGSRLVANLDTGVDWRIGDRVRATFVDHGDRRHPVFQPEEASA